MKFTKMHGCGNDYVYVNGFTEKVADKPKAVVALSDRHFGIGSDGVIFINPSQQADFEMAPERKCAETESAVSVNMYMTMA